MNNRSKIVTILASFTLMAGIAACDKAKPEEGKAKPAPTPAKVAPATNPAKTMPATAAAEPGKTEASPGSSLAKAVGEYTIDSEHTQLVFAVNHLGTSNQYGQFTKVTGHFSIAEDLSKSSISLEVPTGSVFTAAKKRDDHLRGPDFFDAKQFPTITFKSTSVKATGANTYTVSGDLTLHGVTKSIAIDLKHGASAADPEMMGGRFRTGFNGSFSIKRSEFGLNYMPGALGEEIQLLLALEGTRKP